MFHWMQLVVGNEQWQVRSDWLSRLFDGPVLRLSQWRDGRLIETVKNGSHRTVYRVNLPAGAIYLKHYPVSGLRSRVRQLVGATKARAEYHRAIGIAARRIPTVEPLAVGEDAHGGSYFITRALDNAQPLNQFIQRTLPALPGAESNRLRLLLTEQLADLAARLHEAGVVHRDLHAGNILVQWDEAGQPALYLIDLHGVQFRRPLDWRLSRDNLVMLNNWFAPRVSRADRRRFWRLYLRRRRFLRFSRPQERRHARQLERRTWASCLRLWRRRERRSLNNKRYVYHLSNENGRAWAVRDLPAETMCRLLTNPEGELDLSGCRIFKHSTTSTVAELTMEVAGQVRQVIFKRFALSKAIDPWVALVRATPALRSWINGYRLLERGIPTARPLAVIHRRRFGLVRECYLLTEKLLGTMDLRHYVADLESHSSEERRLLLLCLIERLARLVRDLHQRQLSHRDLKAANILVRPQEHQNEAADAIAPTSLRYHPIRQSASPVALFLIDLVGLESWRQLPRARCVQNLARLHVSFHRHPWISQTDKLRFLRTYMAWGLHGKSGWKYWWREIAQATQKKIARNLRRGRPLS